MRASSRNHRRSLHGSGKARFLQVFSEQAPGYRNSSYFQAKQLSIVAGFRWSDQTALVTPLTFTPGRHQERVYDVGSAPPFPGKTWLDGTIGAPAGTNVWKSNQDAESTKFGRSAGRVTLNHVQKVTSPRGQRGNE